MRTEELIRVLVSDLSRQPKATGRSLAAAAVLSPIWAGGALMLTIGVRPDIAAASMSLAFLIKLVAMTGVALSALVLVRQLLYPGSPGTGQLLLLLTGPALLAFGVGIELLATDAAGWTTAAIGKNWMVCLTAIPAFGIVPLGLIIRALRHGAPTRPVLAGFCAGILAGGIGATVYAAHSTDDSLLFVAAWYLPAIGILAVFGGLLGHWFVRW